MDSFSIYRYPNLKSVRDLIYKKGLAKLEKDKVPLTDNNVIEQVSDCRLLQLLLVIELSVLSFLETSTEHPNSYLCSVQALGKYGILCLEDMVHEIFSVGRHFKDASQFLWPFALGRPDSGFEGKKNTFKNGGDSGNREEHINELIAKMT